MVGPIALFLIASFFAGRATVALIDSEGDGLGARRWLVYPPLLIFYLPTVIGLFGWPLALAARRERGIASCPT